MKRGTGMPKCVKFTCFDATASVLTDSDAICAYYTCHKQLNEDDRVPFIDVLFPGIKASECTPIVPKHDYIVCLCHTGLTFDHIDPMRSVAVIARDENAWNIRDVNVLLTSMLSRQLNWHRKSFLHCSAIATSKGATVLLGGMGAGKTSLAVYMARYHGYNIVCNDHAVVGLDAQQHPYMYSGTLNTPLRPGAAKLVIPDRLDVIPESVMAHPWDARFVLNPYFDELDIHVQQEAPIRHIVLVHVEEGTSEICKRIEFEQRFSRRRLDLQESFDPFTRGNAKFLFGIKKILPSFDDDETNQGRDELISQLLQQSDVYEMRGDIKTIASHIVELG